MSVPVRPGPGPGAPAAPPARAPEVAMIFAAGRGLRMRPLTDDRPKPLIEVGGRTLLDRALDLVRAAGLPRAVVNTHYRAAQIAAHLAPGGPPETALSHEPALLDTGGGLRAARALVGPGPVLTLNADAVWTGESPLAPLLAGWDPARMDALLLLVARERAVAHRGAGDFDLDAAGRPVRRGARPGAAFVYTGAQILNPGPVYACPDAVFSLNRVWDALLADGRVFAVLHAGGWCDVGHPEALPLAEAMLA